MALQTYEAICSKVSTGSLVSFEAFRQTNIFKTLSEYTLMAEEHSNDERL